MKSKRYLFLSMATLFALTFGSCRKYVEVDQPNNRTLKYTNDYQLLLNDISTFEKSYSTPLISNDDVDAANNVNIQNTLLNENANAYTWSAQYYTESQSDADWDGLYKQIYTCNEIIAHVLDSENGTDVQKKNIMEEAKFQRAFAYLYLVNLYAPIYNSATEGTDLAVPMLLTPDLFAKLTRPSLATVYNQIIADLQEAATQLPKYPASDLHPGQAAVNGLLARVYLYRRNYQLAGQYAQKSLDLQNSLLDLSQFANGSTTFPNRLNNPEVILSKTAFQYLNLPLSSNLLNLFDKRDLRYTLFTRDGSSKFYPAFIGRGYVKNQLSSENRSVGLTVPEMMLIRAEALARNNQVMDALTLVNALRSKRFKSIDYSPLTAANADAALQLVIDERRRELMGTGLRWLDQRRLGSEPSLAQTVTRQLKGQTYTLAPLSNRYIYPIAIKYINLNPEIVQNPR